MTATSVLPPSLRARVDAAVAAARPRVTGRVTGVLGLTLTAAGADAAVGEVVLIGTGASAVAAEVAAIGANAAGQPTLTCMPLGQLHGIRVGDPVSPTGGPLQISVGESLRGRVLNGLGQPIDGGPPLTDCQLVAVEALAPNALLRRRVDTALPLGVRALDTLVPCGRGQRLGIFAGSGVGKSSLLSMIARGTEAEISVIALVGERGREVREFLENDLGPEGLARSVVVVATGDEPPAVRMRAAFVATRIAEWFRDEGADVLLMMDSVTRVALAQREIGLSAGEPPATRGYPPSAFALLPRLLERAGPGQHGTITGIYTVLVEGDDHNEPIGDTARSILDGHIVLDRRLATAGHFPTIDVLDSISRVAGTITTPEQRAIATELRRLLAARRDAKELIEIGAYVPGTNPEVDRATALTPAIDAFLRQAMDDQTPAAVSWQALGALLGGAA
ncbi:MAG TPA: FliI/YscN family ATPase [Mycobacteriales bacterium]|nr:ATPase, FliI/YscN family [Cryptosporangiaceae bacterium]HEV7755515.1 FliI/YscN family ATPase [Mycobacteriales bacterium]